MQLNGNRIKASGRIIGGACSEHPAFSASYDLVTDEAGITRRLSVRTALAAGERQMSISRDEEGTWMVENGASHQRSAFDGALDVDVILSPFFNTLPIRRVGLQNDIEDAEVPVVYVNLLDLRVEGATITYSSGADGISVLSPGVQLDVVRRYRRLCPRLPGSGNSYLGFVSLGCVVLGCGSPDDAAASTGVSHPVDPVGFSGLNVFDVPPLVRLVGAARREPCVHQSCRRAVVEQIGTCTLQKVERLVQRDQQGVAVASHIARTRPGALPATRVPSRNDPAASPRASSPPAAPVIASVSASR